MNYLRKYGVEATIDFDLFEVDGVDFRIDAAHASGDTKVMKDEGAEGNTDNGFTDEGQGYSIVLTATEMQAARIVVYVVDQTATKVWLDRTIIIETYGNASAQHEFDLDTALTDATIKAAIEADGGDLSSLIEALVNKLVITEASGDAEMFNDAGTTQGTVTAAFTSDGTFTTRKRIFK